jgi:hypothetical protein
MKDGVRISFAHIVVGKLSMVFLLVLAAFCVSCDESLPPREPPRSYVVGAVSVIGEGENIQIFNEAPINVTGGFEVRIRNVYDEVLQDSVGGLVTLDVWLKGHPEVNATVKLSEANLRNWGIISGHILTLPTDSAAVFVGQWSHKADNGTPFWAYAAIWAAVTPGGEPYCQSEPVTIVVHGSAQLFKAVGPVYISEREFRIAYAFHGTTCPAP